ncbi:MAG: hypothetical protein CVU18_16785 [Betaproteobacteria bacterium HGW-Betaproteobacteria-12]|nr:MAG: hypothetical protein CVU18_16785 [Betaproteobacteria bacterium HGW-Betaproteobacteria-12]
MMRNRYVLPLCAVLAMLGFGAYGDENHGPPSKYWAGLPSDQHAALLGLPALTSEATRTIKVDMGDSMRFKPERIEARRGETIRFVVRNQGQVKHEFVLGTPVELKKHAALMAKFPHMEHDDPNAVSVEPGASGEFAWTFTKTGNFAFACLVPGHFEAGMKGRIIVRR